MPARPVPRDGGAMTRLLITVLVRTAVLALGIAAYYLLLPFLFPSEGDANIGAGLLGFALVVVASAVWGLVDGIRRPVTEAWVAWPVVAVLVALLWTVGLTAAEAGSWPGFWDLLGLNLELVPFTTMLVLAPAGIALATGQAIRVQPGRSAS
jgi:hypothetical protein